jgi:tetratricopeptide (TPR) repeat protein
MGIAAAAYLLFAWAGTLQDAKALLDSGNQKHDAGDYDGAILDFNRALALNPKMVAAFLGRAEAYSAKNQDISALQDFRTAVELNPQYEVSHWSMSRCLEKLGRLDEAMDAAQKAIDLDPKSTGGFNQRGNVKYAKKNYDAAIVDYTRVIELNPKAFWAWRNRGNSRYEKGQFDAAIADFTGAIRIDPSAAHYWERGRAHQSKKDYRSAIDDYNRSLLLKPDATIYANRSACHRLLGDTRIAIEDANKALTVTPGHAFALQQRASAYYVEGDFEKAVLDYAEVARISPKEPEVREFLGYSRYFLGEWKLAIADLEEACAQDPAHDASPRLWIYAAKVRLKDPRALEELRPLVRAWKKSKPDDIHTTVGRLYVGEKVEQQLMGETVTYPHEAHFFIGTHRLLAGKNEEAASWFRKTADSGEKGPYTPAAKLELKRIPRAPRVAIPINLTDPPCSLEIPAGYIASEIVPPKALYAFTQTVDEKNDLMTAISIELMGGMLGREKGTSEEMARVAQKYAPSGITFKLATEQWKEFDITIMEGRGMVGGIPMYFRMAQIPLVPQAIQIGCAGPASYEKEIRADLTKVLATVQGKTNWLTEKERGMAFRSGVPAVLGWVLLIAYGIAHLAGFRGQPRRAWKLRVGWLIVLTACFVLASIFGFLYADQRGRSFTSILVPVAAIGCAALAFIVYQRSQAAPAPAVAAAPARAPLSRKPAGWHTIEETAPAPEKPPADHRPRPVAVPVPGLAKPSKWRSRQISPWLVALIFFLGFQFVGGPAVSLALGIDNIAAMTTFAEGLTSVNLILTIGVYLLAKVRYNRREKEEADRIRRETLAKHRSKQ